jgi:hypothetical protein
MLLRVRDELLRWSEESRRGGWSTHLCERMEKLSTEIGRLIVCEPRESLGYPAGWPACPACGKPVLDRP